MLPCVGHGVGSRGCGSARLRAVRDITADFTGIGRTWRLAKGDHLRTEISRKFDLGLLRDELTEHGFEPVTSWTDAAGDFSLTLARVAGRDGGPP